MRLEAGREIGGRLHEIRVPYWGPLDFAIVDLRERYADPSQLTIATNYEAEVFMYYLGSRGVGRFDPLEPGLRPDVIIPR